MLHFKRLRFGVAVLVLIGLCVTVTLKIAPFIEKYEDIFGSLGILILLGMIAYVIGAVLSDVRNINA